MRLFFFNIPGEKLRIIILLKRLEEEIEKLNVSFEIRKLLKKLVAEFIKPHHK
jgi:hypothetical protein